MSVAERHPRIAMAQLHLEREPAGGVCRITKALGDACPRLFPTPWAGPKASLRVSEHPGVSTAWGGWALPLFGG